jgi:uncharacterized small protein (DUF1192 family)
MSDTLTSETIAELRAAVEAMTPGPWAEDGWAIVKVDPQSPHEHVILDRGMTDANRQAIPLLRNAAPALLAAAEELATLRHESDLYRRGYDAMQAADISEYLALCGGVRERDERIAALEAERDQWKANHDEMVARNGILRKRNDLPLDRTDALRRFDMVIQERNHRIAALEAALATALGHLRHAHHVGDSNPHDKGLIAAAIRGLESVSSGATTPCGDGPGVDAG